ncbi:MAG: FHA domain-containing protein [Ilumatobacter sp.]|uniref:FHA domain-containing protein n=1 Tax=Ilumatobacter sp. TaxID=1967498 RepID=UPI0026044D37|nr:FHA domain-containing protein [Ilumatobacter sp.]MDJ0769817.1 FHA domain-containing protein [Ilumatobacter sp.]
MTDQVLDILKLVLLALLYLFFARVLWAVWSEVRQPANARSDYQPPQPHQPQPPSQQPAGGEHAAAHAVAVASAGEAEQRRRGRRQPKPGKGRGGIPARLVVLEPKDRRGTAYAITAKVTIGRDDGNTIQITDDSYISGHHATISLADGYVVVDDIESRNGTFLNGARIDMQRSVSTGDRIQVGYTVLEAQ